MRKERSERDRRERGLGKGGREREREKRIKERPNLRKVSISAMGPGVVHSILVSASILHCMHCTVIHVIS